MNCSQRVITYDKNCNTIIYEFNYDPKYVYIYVLQLNKSNELISNTLIKVDDEDSKFDLGLDGFYTLVTVKIPKDENNNEYYYKNNKIYHLSEEVDLPTLIELNPNVTGLEIDHEYYFQTCRLKKCFINICKLIFDQVHSIECNKSILDLNLVYKRDLLWAALNVIEYMTEQGEFKEAELLLEKIMNCNGLCDNHCNSTHKNTRSSCNCGCI